MKQLTKAEEEVMQLLWKKKKAFVKELIAEMPEPKPAYTTISTVMRVLVKKGVVSYVAFGKTHQYFPLISKKDYTRKFMKYFISDYFSGSFQQMVSFFAKEDNMSLSDLEELLQEVKDDLQESNMKKITEK